MTFNTSNPIGSTDARDRSDNSENLDLAVNSLALTFEDRLGVTRDTLEGIYQKSAYYRAGTFAVGYTLTNNRQTLAYGNVEYSWSGAFPKVVAASSTPETTGGIGAGAWVDRTDVTLRAEITPSIIGALRRSYADAGFNLVDGSFEVGGTLVNVNDVLLQKSSGKAFSGPVGAVLPGTVPIPPTWTPRSDSLLKGEIKASVFASPNSTEDQSLALQAAWDFAAANGLTLVFDSVYYVKERPVTYPDTLVRNVCLQVPSNSVAKMLPLAEIRLIPTSAYSYYIINTYGTENAKLFNFNVIGDVDQHLGTVGEGGHCYNVVNCSDVLLHRCHGSDSWGDGFHVGHEYQGLSTKYLSNVELFECSTSHTGRNGMSLCASNGGLRVIRPHNEDAFRTAPKAGIDIEPESSVTNPLQLRMRDVLVDSPTSKDCKGAGLHVSMTREISTNFDLVVDVTVTCASDTGSEHGVRCDGYGNSLGYIRIINPKSMKAKKAPFKIDWLNTASRLVINDPIGLDGANDAASINPVDTSCVSIVTYNNRGSYLGNFEIHGLTYRALTQTKVTNPIFIKDYSATPARASNGSIDIRNDSSTNPFSIRADTGYTPFVRVSMAGPRYDAPGDNHIGKFTAYSGTIVYNAGSSGDTFVYVDGFQPVDVTLINGGFANNAMSIIPTNGVRIIPYPANQGIKTKPGLGGGATLRLIPVPGSTNFIAVGDLSKWIEIP